MIDLSVIIPVKDEEANIVELVNRLTNTIHSMKVTYEIIFITDLNRDNTYDILISQNENDPHIKTIKLSNSFGHHCAVVAGLENASGSNVVIMDGDLQDYPEDIPKLYNKLKKGFDIVYALKERKDDSFIRNQLSRMFLKVLSILSDFKLDYNTSMFRIISRRTANELLRFKEREPSLTAFMSVIGFPSSTEWVNSGKRQRGKTKYGFIKQVNFAISFLLSFTTKPLRIMSISGIIISGLSFLYLIIVLIQSLVFDLGVLGWPTLVSLITFLGGIQLLAIGIAGEYIGRIFLETKNRPLYIVEEKVGNFE